MIAAVVLIALCAFTPVQQAVKAQLVILAVFALATVAGYAFAYLCNLWGGAPAGVTVDSALSLFYNAKHNEMMSLTVGASDEASSVNATGYYMGRKAEYATMNFLNNTLYPTFPKWQIFNFSSSNMNQSVMAEIGNTFSTWVECYNSAIFDSVRYAQSSFTGPLAGLDLKFDGVSVKTGANDFSLAYGYHKSGTSYPETNFTIGYAIVMPNGTNAIYFNTSLAADTIILINTLTGNTTNLGDPTTLTEFTLTPGVYQVLINSTSWYWNLELYTNVLLVDEGSDNQGSGHFPTDSAICIISPSRGETYTTMNFQDTSAHTYTIDVSNLTDCSLMQVRYSLDATQNFASGLANAYWTTLRNAGIYDISQIPTDQVIPLPDFAFLTNTDLSQLTAAEIQAMYLAYLKALGNFFNSTTYTLITNFNTANVTFNNEGVIVNASFMNNAQNVTWTSGDLYIQVYDDMNLVIGMNLLNSSGLLYNLNDTTCWRYDSGDYLNISHIYVRSGLNGSYVEVQNATITATTIQAYLYNSSSGTPLVPTGGGAAGGGGSSILLLLAIGVIAIVLLRGKTQQSSGPVVVTRTTPQNTKI